MRAARLAGSGWLVLIGGGEFSFGETEEVDRAWLARVPPGPIAFLPTASGSADYGHHFANYLQQIFGRIAFTVPIYHPRDAKRGKNCERIRSAAAVYLGGGVADEFLATLADSPAAEALLQQLTQGGTVVAQAAAAQALGQVVRGLRRNQVLPGLGFLPGGVVETNFDPAHDRRLRQLRDQPGVSWGVGITAGSSWSLGPDGQTVVVGEVFGLATADGELQLIPSTGAPADAATESAHRNSNQN